MIAYGAESGLAPARINMLGELFVSDNLVAELARLRPLFARFLVLPKLLLLSFESAELAFQLKVIRTEMLQLHGIPSRDLLCRTWRLFLSTSHTCSCSWRKRLREGETWALRFVFRRWSKVLSRRECLEIQPFFIKFDIF